MSSEVLPSSSINAPKLSLIDCGISPANHSLIHFSTFQVIGIQALVNALYSPSFTTLSSNHFKKDTTAA